MSKPISDYALIGDTHSCALIARDGSIDWLCWPRHDSPALFVKLLDDEKGGACSVAFDGLDGTERRYLPDTNILETTFTTRTGRARLIDVMPVNPPSPEPDEGPDGEGESRLIRMLTCETGSVTGLFRVCPTFDYARRPCTPIVEGASVLFEAGDWRLRVNAHPQPAVVEGRAEIRFTLAAGETAYLVLTHGEDQQDASIDDFEGGAAPPEEHRRVLASLVRPQHLSRGLSGGRDALGPLPEAADVFALRRHPGRRDRWPARGRAGQPQLRLPLHLDARCLPSQVTAFVMLGYVREASEFLRFLRERDGSYGRDTRLMYGIADGMPPEEELSHLAGWSGVRPVVIGNLAEGQDQHDIYGELLRALCIFLEAVDYDPAREGQRPPAGGAR